ncbi:hypothetical protein BLNAU_22662 [Blattamonas nauphoetae]|uniref:Uncharacterized protein n=1 Tax=Blattamonas nauphoetae TaxID=2049346 RepID=A0ABQ9WTI4_9EUKA|nr:hypothetical protein BLNAU_22662 [Blattamonas nauphoetae]
MMTDKTEDNGYNIVDYSISLSTLSDIASTEDCRAWNTVHSPRLNIPHIWIIPTIFPTATPSTTSHLRIFDLSTPWTQYTALKVSLFSNVNHRCICRRAAMNEPIQQSNHCTWTRREIRRSTQITGNERHQPLHTHLLHSTQRTTRRLLSPRMMQRMHTKRQEAHKHAKVDSSDRNGFDRPISKWSCLAWSPRLNCPCPRTGSVSWNSSEGFSLTLFKFWFSLVAPSISPGRSSTRTLPCHIERRRLCADGGGHGLESSNSPILCEWQKRPLFRFWSSPICQNWFLDEISRNISPNRQNHLSNIPHTNRTRNE